MEESNDSSLRGAFSPHDGSLAAHEASSGEDLLISQIWKSLAVLICHLLARQGKVKIDKTSVRVCLVDSGALLDAADIAF
jgi:hypothetical protein